VNAKKANNCRTNGKSPSKVTRRTYTPISDALKVSMTFSDCALAEGIKRHGVVNLLANNFGKPRREDSEPLPGVLAALLCWPLLKIASIHSFCSELCQFIRGRSDEPQRKQDILYSVMRREDINWRNTAVTLARRIFKRSCDKFGPSSECAFVVDDSIKVRRGKKVQGSSSHWDHTEGRSVRGHQVVELGLTGLAGLVPIDRQIYMGDKNAVNKPEDKGFKDHRSACARDMKRAKEESKHQAFRRMLKAAIKSGFEAAWVLGDAWFGCKENIMVALECGLHAIFQMKRGNMLYRIDDPDAEGASVEGDCRSAQQLYEKHKRKLRKANKKARYKTLKLRVWINTETTPYRQKTHPRWQEVAIVFSAPAQATCGENADTSWVIFLTTSLEVSAEKVLSTYAKRWSIEVYFKEVKQNFGFLAEQSGRYEYAYASIHLSAMRYLLLFEATLRDGSLSYGEMRDKQTGMLQALSWASLLWQLFRALVEGALEGLQQSLGPEVIKQVLSEIDMEVDEFLEKALQCNPLLVASQLQAEEVGYL
jgi:hypothetical protein